MIGLRILWRNRKKDKEKYLKDKCECFISADDENEGTYLIKQENTEEEYYGFSQQIHTSGLENTWKNLQWETLGNSMGIIYKLCVKYVYA